MNMHPEFSSQQVAWAIILTAVAILLITVFGKLIIRRPRDLTQKYKNKVWTSPLEGRTKYPDVEVFKYRGLGLLFGLATALFLTLLLMNWTVTVQTADLAKEVLYIESDIEVTPPQTSVPPPPPPPPPPPKVIEVPDVFVDDLQEAVVFMDQSVEAESAVEAPPPPEPKATTPTFIPPPPPPVKEDVEEIFKVVEEMPRFPGCESLDASKAEKKVCAEKALYTFINEHLGYPSAARENNIQGTVVVQFVVNRDGTIQDITVLRDIGAGCGEEVVRVVDLMNTQGLRWTPGKQRGNPVRVSYILPVKFTLVTS